MLRANSSLKSLVMFKMTIPIEITAQLLAAIGDHASLEKVAVLKSRFGASLEAELHRFERAILEAVKASTTLKSLILEQLSSDTLNMAEDDVRTKRQVMLNLSQQLPQLEHLSI